MANGRELLMANRAAAMSGGGYVPSPYLKFSARYGQWLVPGEVPSQGDYFKVKCSFDSNGRNIVFGCSTSTVDYVERRDDGTIGASSNGTVFVELGRTVEIIAENGGYIYVDGELSWNTYKLNFTSKNTKMAIGGGYFFGALLFSGKIRSFEWFRQNGTRFLNLAPSQKNGMSGLSDGDFFIGNNYVSYGVD